MLVCDKGINPNGTKIRLVDGWNLIDWEGEVVELPVHQLAIQYIETRLRCAIIGADRSPFPVLVESDDIDYQHAGLAAVDERHSVNSKQHV